MNQTLVYLLHFVPWCALDILEDGEHGLGDVEVLNDSVERFATLSLVLQMLKHRIRAQ
jgi:hypothetical protein|tara:strand:- start:895 stop:1068 length:174 start_codon:yes stop_codon:yes gene_type:complete